MDTFDKLKFNRDTLSVSIENEKSKDFFSPILHPIRQLGELLDSSKEEQKQKVEEIKYCIDKVAQFFDKYKPKPDADYPYFPPAQITKNEDTVEELKKLSSELQ